MPGAEDSGFSPAPLQYGLFSNEPEAVQLDFAEVLGHEGVAKWRLSPNVFLVKSADNSELIVAGIGVKLSKKSERVVVKDGESLVFEIPFFRLNEISVQSRGVSLSSDVIEESCKRGVRISFLGFNGKPYALLTSPMLNATVKTRRHQIMAYNDSRGLSLARALVSAKVRNQSALLKYFSKNMKEDKPDLFGRVRSAAAEIERLSGLAAGVEGKSVSVARGRLMGVEGAAARQYWPAFSALIGGAGGFAGRTGRGAADVVNAMLNYGYGMLYSHTWGCVMNAGLEPFAGFLHVDEPGKPSMVLDLVEEFRAPVIDRTVAAYINQGGTLDYRGGLLSQRTRYEFSSRVLDRFESPEYHEGKRYQIKSIIQMQARRAASALRGDSEYRAYSFKW